MEKTNDYDCEQLFTQHEPSSPYDDSSLAAIRTKTIRSGPIVECEIYPIWKRGYGRSGRTHKTRAAQQHSNARNSAKRLSRLLNANFGADDIWLTLTYSAERLPPSAEQAYRDTVNYIRRLKRAAAKAGAPPLKYIVVTETHDADGEIVRAHHHIVVNFPNRDIAEALWKGGGRTQARRLQPDDAHLTGMAMYLCKEKAQPKGKHIRRRWHGSKNLTKPLVSVSDKKISRRAAKRLTKMSDDERRTFFSKLFPMFRPLECTVTYSSVVPGAYIQVRLRR